MLTRNRVLALSCFMLALLPGLTASLAGQAVHGGPTTVRHDVHHDVSPPLRELIRNAPPPAPQEKEAEPVRPIPLPPGLAVLPEDPIRQRTVVPSAAVVGLSFEGLGQGQYGFGVYFAPPDTDGAVGATQYVQWVNTSFAIFDKATGALLSGPAPGYTLWWGFGGGCQSNNDGDVIALYDKLANRWVMSQLSVSTQPYLQCVAVSTTSDALGTWNRYSFQYTDFDDYPKMGVWPDAYYETFNMFDGDQFLGGDACAYDRTAMLNGQSATQICFQQGPSVGGLLPADVDGTTPPPAGSPNYMLYFGANDLNLYQFHVDFNNPANSTFTGPAVLNVAAFTPLCGGGTCVPQPGTSNQLDSLADRLMYRLAYRNFGSHESLVVNHSVAVSGGGGVRWYEIQSPGGTPVLAQQGTFAPDSTYRWMGSMAMDSAGDIAVGYSKSSSSVYPSIAFAGRVPTDPAGTLESETGVADGSGSQSGTPTLHRWGDYSAMTVDPGDDCTFWYTQEYLTSTGTFNWNTRIVNFKFPNCTSATYTLFVSKAGTGSGTVTSNDGLINCGQVCSAAYTGNTRVTLTATPSPGSVFTGWSGCDSVNGNSCTVTMYSTRTATATFTYNPIYYTLFVSVNGNGTVTSTDGFINCPGTCDHSYLQGTQVTLNATPAQGWSFAGWGFGYGLCSGNGPCTLTMNYDISLEAVFVNNLGTVTTLYSFCAQPNCSDGSYPNAVVQGWDGNFYGTTLQGGVGSAWNGTIFRITPNGSLTTLYSFCSQPNCADGATPNAALVQGAEGNFYGTTSSGGASQDGTVFKITPAGLLTTLHSFSGNDGASPWTALVQAGDGNFYGTTSSGGTSQNCYGGCGTVFKTTPDGTLTTLYSFCSQPNCPDGESPEAGLVQGMDGNFYGTTSYGGGRGRGTVFKITPGGTLTTLHNFSGADGWNPLGGLVQGSDGNFYGTTWVGGLINDSCPNGCGTLFKMTPNGIVTTLHSFCSQPYCADGESPSAGLVQGTDGNFYGTTTAGGTGLLESGTIFRITPSGTFTALYNFCSQPGCVDGEVPEARLVQGTDGNFYGTTNFGGAKNYGTVFKLSVPYYSLSVSVNGSGTVTSSDGNINCGPTCSYQYLSGTNVTLTATPAQGWVFTSWSGCDGVNGNVCTVTMNKNRKVTATFTILYQLSVSKVGSGTVTSDDGHINCGPTCSYMYLNGTQVRLTATPAQGWAFSSWSGCDGVYGNVCIVNLSSNRTVTATFVVMYKLSVSVSGNGAVVGGNINCGSVCSQLYPQGTQVKLTALPASGSTLSAWTGCDTMNGDLCTLTMSGPRNVTATFATVQVTLTSLTLQPTTVIGGHLVIATLTLGAPAPSGGVGVSISSNNMRYVRPPGLVEVPGGATSVRFGVRTYPVGRKTVVQITATANASHTSATLTLNPR